MKRLSLLARDTQRSSGALVVLLGFAVVVLALASCAVSAAQQPAAPTAAAPTVAPTAAAPAVEVGASTLPLGSYANPWRTADLGF